MDIELQALWFAAAVSFSLAGGDIEAAGQQEASMYCWYHMLLSCIWNKQTSNWSNRKGGKK